MKHFYRILSLSVLILVSGFTLPAATQDIPDADDLERLLTNPRRTVHTFLFWQMRGHEQPQLPPVTMLSVPDLDEEERMDRARQLLAVLDARGLYVELENIPSNPAYEDTLSGLHQYILFQELPEIYLSRIDGLWYFDPASVEKIPQLYRSTFSIFTDVVLDNLPEAMYREWLGFQLWQLLGLFIWLFMGLLIRWAVKFSFESYIRKYVESTESAWDEMAVKEAEKPISFIAMMGFYWLTYTNLMLSVTMNMYIRGALTVALSIGFVWLLYGFVNVLSAFLASLTKKEDSVIDDQLVPLIRKTLKVFVVVVGSLFVLSNTGYNIASLLAGLGLGGLAFALAARDTLANFFGSITIFADRPFGVGDWINTGQIEGTVEEIGFRSTRIRTFYNSLVSVPNSVVANSSIDNMGRREFRRIRTFLNIHYATPPEKIEAFVEGIKAILLANRYMRKDFFEVHFNDFGSHSLNILIHVFLKVPTWSDELRERQNFFMEILRLAKEIGVEFAYPTQTLHIDSHYQESPRKLSKSDITDDELAAAVMAFAPGGKKSSPEGLSLKSNGKIIDFRAGASREANRGEDG